jgi:NhaP-type Na+/H+ or K+/H+ antiporter
MGELHLGYALVGSLAVVLAAMSTNVRDLPLSEPLLALVLGVVVGPEVLGLIQVPEDQRPRLMTEVARVLLAVSLMGVGLRYPVRQLRGVLSPTALLVTVGMVGMAALTAALMWLVLGVPVALAVLRGACLTPTDPVLASSVVTGKPAEEHLPLRTRQLLSAESGTNDGLALPLVLVGIALFWGRRGGAPPSRASTRSVSVSSSVWLRAGSRVV